MFSRQTAAWRSRSLFKADSWMSDGSLRENCRFQIFCVSLMAKLTITFQTIFST
jgi:hypothetical protein